MEVLCSYHSVVLFLVECVYYYVYAALLAYLCDAYTETDRTIELKVMPVSRMQ